MRPDSQRVGVHRGYQDCLRRRSSRWSRTAARVAILVVAVASVLAPRLAPEPRSRTKLCRICDKVLYGSAAQFPGPEGWLAVLHLASQNQAVNRTRDRSRMGSVAERGAPGAQGPPVGRLIVEQHERSL